MGQRREYFCPKCDFSAIVSGGKDAGFFTVTETISCVECAELFDAVANEKPQAVLNTGVLPGDWKSTCKLTGLQCPENLDHAIALWVFPGPCPKCGTVMEEGGVIEQWD